jgi:hypothetical protein
MRERERERERVTGGWENCIMRTFILIIVLLVQCYYDDLIMEDEMGMAYREEKCIQSFGR